MDLDLMEMGGCLFQNSCFWLPINVQALGSGFKRFQVSAEAVAECVTMVSLRVTDRSVLP
jgi:hypothetical protein